MQIVEGAGGQIRGRGKVGYQFYLKKCLNGSLRLSHEVLPLPPKRGSLGTFPKANFIAPFAIFQPMLIILLIITAKK